MTETVSVEGGLKEALQLYTPQVGCAHHASLLKHFFGSKVAHVHTPDSSRSVIVKYGYSVEILNREVDNIRLVAKETSIPLPKLLGTHTAEDEDGNSMMFIVMEKAEGSTLQESWPTLDHAEKSAITSELAGYIRQLQSITGSFIGSVGRKQCIGRCFSEPFKGPFETEEMNQAILYTYNDTLGGYFSTMLKNMLQTGHPIVFAHNDIHLGNIIVSHGRISAIIDWEHAGFYPIYWEYANTMVSSRLQSARDWCVYAKRFFVQYDYQANVHVLINMYLY